MGFDIAKSDKYQLMDFTFENINLKTAEGDLENAKNIKNVILKNVIIKAK